MLDTRNLKTESIFGSMLNQNEIKKILDPPIFEGLNQAPLFGILAGFFVKEFSFNQHIFK